MAQIDRLRLRGNYQPTRPSGPNRPNRFIRLKIGGIFPQALGPDLAPGPEVGNTCSKTLIDVKRIHAC